MKYQSIVVLIGVILRATFLYAGNGNLIVDGSLGVGTATPLSKLGLSVDSSIASVITTSAGLGGNGVVIQGSGGVYNSKSGIYSSWSGGTNGLASGIVFGREGNNWGTFVALHTHPDLGNYDDFIERVRITKDGSVGIGTPTPAYPLQVIGTLAATTKNFDIPDPRYNDEEHRLIHSTLEGPEVGVYYRGNVQLKNGLATVELPPYFEALTRKENRTVLLTANYENQGQLLCQLAASYVAQGSFVIKAYGQSDSTLCNHKVYWEVKAERNDVGKNVSEKVRRKAKYYDISEVLPLP